MVDFDIVVSKHFISDCSFSDKSSRSEDVLDALDFDVQALIRVLVHQKVVQLETTKYRLLVDFVVGEAQ